MDSGWCFLSSAEEVSFEIPATLMACVDAVPEQPMSSPVPPSPSVPGGGDTLRQEPESPPATDAVLEDVDMAPSGFKEAAGPDSSSSDSSGSFPRRRRSLVRPCFISSDSASNSVWATIELEELRSEVSTPASGAPELVPKGGPHVVSGSASPTSLSSHPPSSGVRMPPSDGYPMAFDLYLGAVGDSGVTAEEEEEVQVADASNPMAPFSGGCSR